MCYLIAKHIDINGCIAIKMEHDENLTSFKESLEDIVGYDKIQLVIISRPSAYGEYEPYRFANSEEEFKEAVIIMQSIEV